MEKVLKKTLADPAEQTPGFVAGAVALIEEGLPAAEITLRPGFQTSAAAAVLAGVVKTNLKAIAGIDDREEIEDILINTSKYYFLIKPVGGKPYFLFLATEKDEWLGRTRMLLKNAGRLLATTETRI